MAILIESAISTNPAVSLAGVQRITKTNATTLTFWQTNGTSFDWTYSTQAQRDTDYATLLAANDPIGTRPYVISHSVIATDAEIAAVAGTAYVLPDAVLTEARDIVIPEGTDGDVMEFYSNDTGFDWSFAGEAVLDAAGAAITTLTVDTIYVVRFVGGAWRAW